MQKLYIKNPFILILSLFLFASCGEGEKVKELESQNQALEEAALQKEETVNKLLFSINQIQENLNKIKSKEGVVRISTNDDVADANVVSINEDIKLISELMKQNEELMQDLQQQLKNASADNKELLRLVDNLKEQLNERNQKIAALNHELQEKKIKIGQLYFSVDSLAHVNKTKESELRQTTDKLFEAYYAYGTFKELKEKKVLSKEGGILGIGSKESLSEDFNKDYFSKIDIREQTSFLIMAKKAELVTNHPSGSYEFMGGKEGIDSLVITNSDEFWSASKYLVIVVDGYQN